jgi:YVTN family beta-propeller protein
MKNMTYYKADVKTFIICMLLFVIAGCTSTDVQRPRHDKFKGQATLFMKGPEKAHSNITFEISAINIVSVNGVSTEISNTPMLINSFDLEGRQVALGESVLPEGSYNKLQFIVREASVKKKGRQASLAMPPEGIDVAININVKRTQNTTLFLNWNADASVSEGYLFKPVFTARGKSPELGSLLLYVTNEDTDNVSVINRQSGEITATVMVGNRPRGIAVSGGRESLKVYVANSEAGSISVIDPTTSSVDKEIPIRFGKEPVDVTTARVFSGKDLLFVANYGSNNISTVDATTLQELEKINVGKGPIAIAVDPPVSELRVSRSMSFEDMSTLRSYRANFINVYVVNYNSNDVSIVRIDIRTQRSVEVITLDVDWNPIALDMDYQRGKVYVANYGSDKLSVIDILKVVKGNYDDAVSAINNIGRGVVDVISAPQFDRLYLLKERAGEIVIIRPFADAFDSLKSVMPPIMGIIRVGKMPRAFVLGPEGRKIYIVNRGSNSISVVDRTTKKEEQIIPVGANPYGITVFRR